LLRWYWWRVNAWSEISAMAAALATTLALHSHSLWMGLLERPVPFQGSDPVVFAKTTLCTTGVTTLVWLTVTLLTPAEPEKTLVDFYRRVRPDVRGWEPVDRASGAGEATRDLGTNLLSWLIGCIFVYAALFSIGQFCFGRMGPGLFLGLVCAASGVALYRLMPKPTEWRVS
jgi:solute:Na+ symporter, SSS family